MGASLPTGAAAIRREHQCWQRRKMDVIFSGGNYFADAVKFCLRLVFVPQPGALRRFFRALAGALSIWAYNINGHFCRRCADSFAYASLP
jgi:hypothetical protein